MKHLSRWLACGGLCLLLVPGSVSAQTGSATRSGAGGRARAGARPTPTPKPTPKPAEKPKDSPAAGPAGGGGSVLGGGDFPFKSIQALSMSGDSSGTMILVDKVSVVGDDLSIDCDRLKVNSDSKLVVAKGSPCKIKMGDLDAWCVDFTHHMDTKTSHLEGNPKIVSHDANGGSSTMTADIIDLTQDASGHVSWTLKQKPGSQTIPTIKKDEASKATETKPAAPAAKVKDNLDLLQMPVVR